MLAKVLNVHITELMGFVCELASIGESRLLGRREVGPIAIERGDVVLIEAGTQELGFLMSHAVLAVVGAGDDPE